MKKPIFLLKKLFYTKNKSKILSINKFDFHRGAMYLFTGSMGSGKSTLLNILSKNHNIDNGLVFYEDSDINKVNSSTYKKEVLFLDKVNKRPWFGGNVKAYMKKNIQTQLDQDYEKAFKKICNAMKIPDYILKSDISELSDGEFRWILLAIAISIDTKVLIINYLEKHLDSWLQFPIKIQKLFDFFHYVVHRIIFFIINKSYFITISNKKIHNTHYSIE